MKIWRSTLTAWLVLAPYSNGASATDLASQEKTTTHVAPNFSSPSFDCNRTDSVAEKLICQHADLAQLDREVAAAFTAALHRLDDKGDTALRKEQEVFNHLRDSIAAPDYRGYMFDGDPPHGRLKSLLQGRRNFLLSIRKPVDEQKWQAATGRWENYLGIVDIIALKKGRGGVSAAGTDPYSARWVCEFEGDGNYYKGALIIDKRSSGGTKLKFARDGDLLVVTETLREGESGPPYCGYRGTLADAYFFTNKK